MGRTIQYRAVPFEQAPPNALGSARNRAPTLFYANSKSCAAIGQEVIERRGASGLIDPALDGPGSVA